jgi:hypothetical protein
MTKNRPLAWLAEHTTILPSVVTRALDVTVAEPARQAVAAIADAAPFADGIEARLRQADSALECAQDLEAEAAEKVTRAREASEEVDVVRDTGADDVQKARAEADQRAKQVVEEAQREADKYVAAKRQRAQENADRDVAEVQEKADERTAKAEGRADQSRAEAEDAVSKARAQMVEARRIAEEAAQAARQAAEEARERADQLSQQAEERVSDAERRTQAVTEEGRTLASAADEDPLDLDDMTKVELLELAGGMGLEVNGSRLKKDLVTAIRRKRSSVSTSA